MIPKQKNKQKHEYLYFRKIIRCQVNFIIQTFQAILFIIIIL